MDMIRLGDSLSRVLAEVKRSARNDVTIEIDLSKAEKKILKINGVRHPKIGDVVGQLNAVVFSDSDIDMVRGEPSRRRRFLNLEISQIRPQYVYALGRYKRVLDQRNNLLREIKVGIASRNDLEVWDGQLASYGATVIARRAEFVRFLEEASTRIYSTLTGGTEEFRVCYKANVEPDADLTEPEISARFLKSLAEKRDLDLNRATTHTGPHRDDLTLTVNGLAAREFASQGQQRTAAIALKLAEIDLMEQTMGEPPIVLLDDIMAELDESRRQRIFDSTVGRCQTIVTTTHISEIGPSVLERCTVFEVRAGTVTRQ